MSAPLASAAELRIASVRRGLQKALHQRVDTAAQRIFADASFLDDTNVIPLRAAMIGSIVQAGQQLLVSHFNADLSGRLSLPAPPRISPQVFERPGVDKTTEYSRPFYTSLRLVRNGKSEPEAMDGGSKRLRVMSATDLQMAKVRQARIALKAAGRKTFKRVTTSGKPCELCELASDQIYYTEDLMPIHPGCVPGDSLIGMPPGDGGASGQFVATKAATRRFFDGELVEFVTTSGNLVRVTPNHPVLTEQGWIAAHLLGVGDTVFRSSGSHRPIGGGPQVHQRPVAAEDVFRTLNVVFGLVRMPLFPKDFHADGTDGEVDIVWTASDFASIRAAEHIRELQLVDAHGRWAGLDGLSALNAFLQSGFTSTSRLVGGDGDSGALLERGSLVTKRRGLPAVSRFDAPVNQFSGNGFATYAERGRALKNRLAGQVEIDSIVECRRIGFAGHVYNFQTAEGWYISNNCIVSNCSCDVEADEDSVDSGDALSRAQEDEDQHSVDDLEVREHGEIGPLLTWAKDDFTGPDDLPSPPSVIATPSGGQQRGPGIPESIYEQARAQLDAINLQIARHAS